jgi:hypothetical protein
VTASFTLSGALASRCHAAESGKREGRGFSPAVNRVLSLGLQSLNPDLQFRCVISCIRTILTP